MGTQQRELASGVELRGMIGSICVLLGGLVVSPLPESAAAMQWDALLILRDNAWGRMLGLTLVMLGLGQLAAGWLALCRHAARHRDDVARIRVAAAAWSAPLLIAPPLFSRDGWSYAAQGMLVHLDRSPYHFGPGILVGPISEAVDPRWMFTLTPYGPVPLLVGEWFSKVTADPWALVVGYRALALLGLAMLAWAVPRLARWSGANPALASAIVLAAPFMIANGIGGLHNDLLMVGLMAVALVLAAEKHWLVGVVIGAVAAAVKLPGGLICIPIVLLALPVGVSWTQRLRLLVGAAATAVGVLLTLGMISGLGHGWVQALSVPGTVNTPLSLPTVIGGLGDWLLAPLGAPEALMVEWSRAVAGVASVALYAWVALRGETGSREAALRSAAVITLASVLLSPVVHLWYLLWTLPFIAACRLPQWGTRLLLAASLIFGLVAPLDSSLHGAYLAIVMGVVWASLIAVVLLVTRRARQAMQQLLHRSDQSLAPVVGSVVGPVDAYDVTQRVGAHQSLVAPRHSGPVGPGLGVHSE